MAICRAGNRKPNPTQERGNQFPGGRSTLSGRRGSPGRGPRAAGVNDSAWDFLGGTGVALILTRQLTSQANKERSDFLRKGFRIFLASMISACWFSTAGASSLGIGDQGNEVAEVQTALAGLGYDVVADGDFGPGTVAAVSDFQAACGMEADGSVGPATYSALLGKDMPEISRGSNYYARRIVQAAMEHLGTPYVFGGTSPGGFDCSGYVRYVFAHAGISLPRMADEQYEMGRPVSEGSLRAGDLVFFSTYDYGASHVGIYLSDGNFINASTSRGVAIDSLHSEYWGSCYIGARRIM